MDPLWAIVPTAFVLLLKLYLMVSAGTCRSKASMEGKVAVVTGANSGIGFETACELAQRRARVVLACRDVARGRRAEAAITARTGSRNLAVHHLDLSSLDSVRQFAATISATERRLDVLVHNAGMTPPPGRHLTGDGLEVQFQTNHFGPFLLTHLLLDLLKRSAPSRVVVVSSVTHWWASLDVANLNCERRQRHPYWVYCSTKLANILFVRELARRLRGTGITVNALHPGGVRTGIARNGQWFIRYLIVPLIYFFLKSARSGAQTSVHLAVAEEIEGTSGEYFVDCRPARTSRLARDDELARELWDKSEACTGIRKANAIKENPAQNTATPLT